MLLPLSPHPWATSVLWLRRGPLCSHQLGDASGRLSKSNDSSHFTEEGGQYEPAVLASHYAVLIRLTVASDLQSP